MDVIETFPGTRPQIELKVANQSAPAGQEGKWTRAADMNDFGQMCMALGRMMRALAGVAAITGTAEPINGLGVRLTGDFAGGLPVATADMPSNLNRLFAAAVEKIAQGGSLSGAGASTPFFGVGVGPVSMAAVTGTLYGFTVSGALATYGGGQLPPVALGLNASNVMFDGGGRVILDGDTLAFLSSGYAAVRVDPTLSSGANGVGIAQSTVTIASLSPLAYTVLTAGFGFSSAGAFSLFIGDVNSIVGKVNEVLAAMTTYRMRA